MSRQSKRTRLNPHNVAMVLEEASRRLEEEGVEGQRETPTSNRFKQKVKYDSSMICLQALLVKNSIRIASRSSKVNCEEQPRSKLLSISISPQEKCF